MTSHCQIKGAAVVRGRTASSSVSSLTGHDFFNDSYSKPERAHEISMDILEGQPNQTPDAGGKQNTYENDTYQRIWTWSYVFLALLCLAAYLLLRLHVFEIFGTYLELLKKIALTGFFAFLILTTATWIEQIVANQSHVKSTRYNLIKLIKLVSVAFIGLAGISVFFQNWYTAAVSLGLISLLVGFALQTPITSLIGWLYIVIRAPYHIGDRIQLQEFTGDVVEIGYLDTTLWEFAGDYLTNDLPSGRLIRFPNSLVLQSAVFNYSWIKFPYIWNEIPFHIAYESDLSFVETTLREVTKNVLGPEMAERVQELKALIKKTPIDELEIKEYPFVCFRVNTNTWLEVIVTYLVHPKQATSVRSQILKQVVAALLKEPDRVMFPKSNAR
jgi:small-conductance mechanosensitive channel